MTMQNLYIHVGTHKTATTWLQHYLAKNSDLLNDLGFYYPTSGRVTQAQHRLGQAIFNRKAPKEKLDGIAVWERFKREISQVKYQNIIISSEEFEWVQHPALIKRFLPEFSIRPIIYLRRQDDYIESLYGQQIRDFQPRLKKTIHQYLETSKLAFLDYKRLISQWQQAADAIHIRVFDRKFMKNGDVGADFLNVLGITDPSGFEPASGPVIDQKTNLSMEALEFMRQCNALPMTAAQHMQLINHVIRLDKVATQAQDKKRLRLLDFQTRKQIMERYRSMNSAISAAHPSATGLKNLFPEISDDAAVFSQAEQFNMFDVLLKANSLVKMG